MTEIAERFKNAARNTKPHFPRNDSADGYVDYVNMSTAIFNTFENVILYLHIQIRLTLINHQLKRPI